MTRGQNSFVKQLLTTTNNTSARVSKTRLEAQRGFGSLDISKANQTLTVSEFIKVGLKHQTNMRKPKFGIKYYKI